MAEAVEAPASISDSTLFVDTKQTSIASTTGKFRVIVITERCAKCNPKLFQYNVDRQAFLKKLNLRLSMEEVLFYPVEGGTSPEIIASGVTALVKQFSGITKIIRIDKLTCDWHRQNTPRIIGNRALTESELWRVIKQNQLMTLIATHRVIAEHLTAHNVSVELYHDTGRLVPERIHTA